MPAPTNTLLIEGSFEELVEEFGTYVDNLRKAHGDEASAIQSECAKLLEENKRDDVLKKLVIGSAALNSAPEKEFIAAYNLLIHLLRQSGHIENFLPKVVDNLKKPITSSPSNGLGLALSVLSTIFNILQPDDDTRFHVFKGILEVTRSANAFDVLKPQLKHLTVWLEEWESDEEEQREVYLTIAELAQKQGDAAASYHYLIKALRTFPNEESNSEDCHKLSIRALKAALTLPTHFDFQDVIDVDGIQALRSSDPVFFEFLDIFNAQTLEDLNDFKDSHNGWIEQQGLDGEVLNRKMRLLTLASAAASASQSRVLSYEKIAKDLQIPQEEVEMWVIDVIRAGLVEGKLSQQNQQFLIHRSTYRVFGENQWKEVASRLDMWRNSLTGVLEVIKLEKQNFAQEKEQQAKDAAAKANGEHRGGYGRRQQQRQERTDDMD